MKMNGSFFAAMCSLYLFVKAEKRVNFNGNNLRVVTDLNFCLSSYFKISTGILTVC